MSVRDGEWVQTWRWRGVTIRFALNADGGELTWDLWFPQTKGVQGVQGVNGVIG